MVQTRSQLVGDNPENIIPLIHGVHNENDNQAGGFSGERHAGGNQTGYGQGHSRAEPTHFTPIDSNYPNGGVSVESEKELIRLRMEKEVLLQMLKEQMANNGPVVVKGTRPEQSHVCSTKEGYAPDVNESTFRDRGKRPMGVSRVEIVEER